MLGRGKGGPSTQHPHGQPSAGGPALRLAASGKESAASDVSLPRQAAARVHAASLSSTPTLSARPSQQRRHWTCRSPFRVLFSRRARYNGYKRICSSAVPWKGVTKKFCTTEGTVFIFNSEVTSLCVAWDFNPREIARPEHPDRLSAASEKEGKNEFLGFQQLHKRRAYVQMPDKKCPWM